MYVFLFAASLEAIEKLGSDSGKTSAVAGDSGDLCFRPGCCEFGIQIAKVKIKDCGVA